MRPLSADETAANYAYVRKRLKAYFWLAMLPALAAIWGAGYAYGLIDNCAAQIRETISKESTK